MDGAEVLLILAILGGLASSIAAVVWFLIRKKKRRSKPKTQIVVPIDPIDNEDNEDIPDEEEDPPPEEPLERGVCYKRDDRFDYARRESTPDGEMCPEGWQDNGCTWDNGTDLGELQCRRFKKIQKTVLVDNNATDIPKTPDQNNDKKPNTTTTKKPPAKTTTKKPSSGSVKWLNANATWYESYPRCCEPTSKKPNPAYDPKAPKSECDDYSGCKYMGQFTGTDKTLSYDEVKSRNIVAFYDDKNQKKQKEDNAWWMKNVKGKKIIIRNPENGVELEVDPLDTCGNYDCDGCCTKNSKGAGYLIDLEINTAKKFYKGGKVKDEAKIQWRWK